MSIQGVNGYLPSTMMAADPPYRSSHLSVQTEGNRAPEHVTVPQQQASNSYPTPVAIQNNHAINNLRPAGHTFQPPPANSPTNRALEIHQTASVDSTGTEYVVEQHSSRHNPVVPPANVLHDQKDGIIVFHQRTKKDLQDLGWKRNMSVVGAFTTPYSIKDETRDFRLDPRYNDRNAEHPGHNVGYCIWCADWKTRFPHHLLIHLPRQHVCDLPSVDESQPIGTTCGASYTRPYMLLRHKQQKHNFFGSKEETGYEHRLTVNRGYIKKYLTREDIIRAIRQERNLFNELRLDVLSKQNMLLSRSIANNTSMPALPSEVDLSQQPLVTTSGFGDSNPKLTKDKAIDEMVTHRNMHRAWEAYQAALTTALAGLETRTMPTLANGNAQTISTAAPASAPLATVVRNTAAAPQMISHSQFTPAPQLPISNFKIPSVIRSTRVAQSGPSQLPTSQQAVFQGSLGHRRMGYTAAGQGLPTEFKQTTNPFGTGQSFPGRNNIMMPNAGRDRDTREQPHRISMLFGNVNANQTTGLLAEFQPWVASSTMLGKRARPMGPSEPPHPAKRQRQ